MKKRRGGDNVKSSFFIIYFLLILPLLSGFSSAASKDDQESQNAAKSDIKQDKTEEKAVRLKRKSDYLTAYACEGSRLQIACEPGLFIDVIRANYGRFSITICNDHGNTEWSVNCMSPRTIHVVRDRCGNRNSCDVPVESSIFTDPCQGTFKYVEVHYECRKEPAQPTTPATPPPRPPWFQVDSAAQNTWSTINDHLNGLKGGDNNNNSQQVLDLEHFKKDEGADDSSSEDPLAFSSGKKKPKVIEVRVPKPFDFGSGGSGGISRRKPNPHLPIQLPETTTTSRSVYIPSTSSPSASSSSSSATPSTPSSDSFGQDVQVMVNFTQYCPPTTVRDLFWNWTHAGDTAVLQCPSGSQGFAKWRCGSDSNWSSQAPSFAECRSLWLADLDSRLREGVPIANVSSSLAYYSGLAPMYGGDIVLASKMLKHMSERMHYEMQRIPSLETREAMVTELVQNVVRSASHIVDRMNHRSWNDLGRDEIGQAASALMTGLEENAFLLADAVTSEKVIVTPADNVLLSIRVMQSRNAAQQNFPSLESAEAWDPHGDYLTLNKKALLRNGDDGAVRVVFATFNQLEQLLTPSSNSKNHDEKSYGYFVNSKVIAASLGKGHHVRLPEPVSITFKHLRTINVSRPLCVFWDFASHSWSKEGCGVVKSNRTHTQCQCDHLTNFALLMAPDDSNPGSSSAKTAAGFKPKTTRLSTHVSTIVAGVAALVSISVIVFFLIMAWRRLKMSNQCRNALEKSGLPCFHKGKDLADKDKGNKGNFYTVTPKLNAAGNSTGNAQNGGNESNEAVEQEQYFQHMISLQKSQGTLVPNKRRNLPKEPTAEDENNPTRRSSATGLNGSVSMNHGDYPRRNTFARALSPYNHIYMEIDGTEAGGAPENNHNGAAVYEPLTHSETYMMSTVSDMSEDNYNFNNAVNYSDGSRQSSSRDSSRPLIRPGSLHERNLLQTISGVLHSQSVRINPNSNNQHQMLHSNGAATLNPMMRRSMFNNVRQISQNNDILNNTGSHTLGRSVLERLRQQQQQQQSNQQQQQPQIPLQLVNGNSLRPEMLTRLAQEQGSLQVTSLNGSQFVCLNISQQQQPNNNSEGNYVSSTTSDSYVTQRSIRPGQIQAAVHSQLAQTVSSPQQPQPQFALPINTENKG